MCGQTTAKMEDMGDDLVIEAPEPLPEPIMVELRQHKAEVINFLNWPVARVILLHCPPNVPEEWGQGICDLLAMACPASCPEARWNVLREDSYTFLRDWAARAHELGWTEYDLFGTHPEKPWVRFDRMGLLLVLDGGRVVALSDIEAVIEKPSGARTTFRPRGLTVDETCLLWNLK